MCFTQVLVGAGRRGDAVCRGRGSDDGVARRLRARRGEAGDADVAMSEGDGAGVCASSMGEMAGLMAAIDDVDMDEGAEIEGVVEEMVAGIVATAKRKKNNLKGRGVRAGADSVDGQAKGDGSRSGADRRKGVYDNETALSFLNMS